MKLINVINKQRKQNQGMYLDHKSDLPPVKQTLIGDFFLCINEGSIYVNANGKYLKIENDKDRKEYNIVWS